MKPIIYKTITTDDNMMLIVQALIDKQAEIIDFINGLSDMANNSNLYKDKYKKLSYEETMKIIHDAVREVWPNKDKTIKEIQDCKEKILITRDKCPTDLTWKEKNRASYRFNRKLLDEVNKTIKKYKDK